AIGGLFWAGARDAQRCCDALGASHRRQSTGTGDPVEAPAPRPSHCAYAHTIAAIARMLARQPQKKPLLVDVVGAGIVAPDHHVIDAAGSQHRRVGVLAWPALLEDAFWEELRVEAATGAQQLVHADLAVAEAQEPVRAAG